MLYSDKGFSRFKYTIIGIIIFFFAFIITSIQIYDAMVKQQITMEFIRVNKDLVMMTQRVSMETVHIFEANNSDEAESYRKMLEHDVALLNHRYLQITNASYDEVRYKGFYEKLRKIFVEEHSQLNKDI